MGNSERKLARPGLSPANYFDEVLNLFDSLTSYHTDQLSLAGRVVGLLTPSQGLRNRLLPALAHLVQNKLDSDPDLTIWYAEDKHLPAKMKAPPWPAFNAQGFNPEICREDIQVFFQPWQTQFFLYSGKKKTGIYWSRTAEDVPWWECTFPFRAIFHFWTRDLPAQLVHAGAMAKDGAAVLITGQSGSGKSTSCLNLLKAGYGYLGDDYVWVESGEQATVHMLYQTAKIAPENLRERFAGWIPHIRNSDTYQQQKAIFHIAELFPEALVPSAGIRAILLPQVAHQENTRFMQATPSRTLLAMAPTTLHHLPHHRSTSYRKLIQLSGAAPGYHWLLGYNTDHFTRSFSEFLSHELS